MIPRQGKLPSLLEVAVKLVFKPNLPINFYKRFFILIGDAMPLFYDAYGTGFIRAKGEVKEQRPAPLRHAHVQAYRNRQVAGLGVLNPDEMDEIVRREGHSELFAIVGLDGTRAMATTGVGNPSPLTRTGEASRCDIAPAHEFFIDDCDGTAKEITLSTTNLDFGFAPFMSSSEAKTVNVTNRTNGKVVIQWVLPRTRGEKNEAHSELEEDSIATIIARKFKDPNAPQAPDFFAPSFAVEPKSIDLNPGKTQTFKVYFRPMQSNRNYVSELEAMVYFKNQRTFRLVNDSTLTPPWSLTLRTIGHTFATGQLLAKAVLTGGAVRGGKLVFPCTYVGDAGYQTIRLINSSNLPSTFRFAMLVLA